MSYIPSPPKSVEFPSPCGEKVGINLASDAASLRWLLSAEFPSPCGEKVGINSSGGGGSPSFASSAVSVPLRGKGRDQPRCILVSNHRDEVSVPLRGKGRDQPKAAPAPKSKVSKVFPSPCGEKVGINSRQLYLSTKRRLPGFPSPCGEKVGINMSMQASVNMVKSTMEFPSPCGEKVGINPKEFLLDLASKEKVFPSPCGEKVGINTQGRDEVTPRHSGFRPLAGKR
mgnify:CR=1 FL=1